MKILITGICGFAGSSIARALKDLAGDSVTISGIDNLSRPGSAMNRTWLRQHGVTVHHGDLRMPSDLEGAGHVDWLIDAAANASVLAGVDGATSSRQLVEHNLIGTVNQLEFCRAHSAGYVLLSSSRVYSIAALTSLPLRVEHDAFALSPQALNHPDVTAGGVTESFPTTAPISLYGATKLASEVLAMEYAQAFHFPVWINRCGVLAGAGQFGQPTQGIYAYWLNAYLRQAPLQYIGFGGSGHQVRDCLHPTDLARAVWKQVQHGAAGGKPTVQNLSGGVANSMSLAQLTSWCKERFGAREIDHDPVDRPFDVPWLVLDHSRASAAWSWQPEIPILQVLEEIAAHAQQHPEWLDISRA